MAVSNLVEEEYGLELSESEDSLELLQRIIDDQVIDSDNAYGLHCLGLVFGRIIASNHGQLDWWIIDDKFGRDPVLRYGQTSLRIGAITMISKRIEDNEPVDIRNMYHSVIDVVEDIIAKGEAN